MKKTIRDSAFYKKIGSKGGQKTSRKKTLAAKRNGKLGGRPKETRHA